MGIGTGAAPLGALPQYNIVLAEADPSSEQEQVAKEFPPGMVQVERSGTKTFLNVTGGLLGVGGAAMLAGSLLTKAPAGAIASRMATLPLILGGSLVGAGAMSLLGSSVLPAKDRLAVATNIPTQAKAGEIAGGYPGRSMEVVQTTKGDWAVIDNGPAKNYGSHSYNRGHYYGDGHYHGTHYYGDGHYHDPGYYEPYYPDPDDSWYNPPARNYPSGGTSRGDDSGSGSGGWTPSYPSGGTSSGDSGGYSYDPPSSGGSSGGSSSWGNSSSNGNPSYDDF